MKATIEATVMIAMMVIALTSVGKILHLAKRTIRVGVIAAVLFWLLQVGVLSLGWYK